jgi:hypothetical protein
MPSRTCSARRPESLTSKEQPVWDFISRELRGRGGEAAVAFLLGGLVSWALSRWRRMRERRSILRGDARDTVVIEKGHGGGLIARSPLVSLT